MIEAHRGAFEYDWRTRFHVALSTVGEAMSWGEAYRLVQVLNRDPSSAVSAAIGDWEYPVSRDALALMDLYDLQHMAKSKRKPKPYPRPWGTGKRTFGRAGMSKKQLRVLLDAQRDR